MPGTANGLLSRLFCPRLKLKFGAGGGFACKLGPELFPLPKPEKTGVWLLVVWPKLNPLFCWEPKLNPFCCGCCCCCCVPLTTLGFGLPKEGGAGCWKTVELGLIGVPRLEGVLLPVVLLLAILSHSALAVLRNRIRFAAGLKLMMTKKCAVMEE